MCLSKIRIVDKIHGQMFVPCGMCYQCQKTKRAEWSFRLAQEWKVAENSTFATFTYNEDGLIYGAEKPTVRIQEVCSAMKRLRKNNPRLRYYAVSEYGEKSQRPHYHAIIFNANKEDIIKSWRKLTGWKDGKRQYREIGNVHLGNVTEASIHYVTKYQISRSSNTPNGSEKPKSVMSKHLGLSYLHKAKDYHTINKPYLTFKGGYTIPMPRYYQQKIYTIGQRKRIYLMMQEAKDEYEKNRIKKMGSRLHHQRRLGTEIAYDTELRHFTKSNKI